MFAITASISILAISGLCLFVAGIFFGVKLHKGYVKHIGS